MERFDLDIKRETKMEEFKHAAQTQEIEDYLDDDFRDDIGFLDTKKIITRSDLSRAFMGAMNGLQPTELPLLKKEIDDMDEKVKLTVKEMDILAQKEFHKELDRIENPNISVQLKV